MSTCGTLYSNRVIPSKQHSSLTRQHVIFEGVNYFRNPTLLEFVAENPIRHSILHPYIVEVAEVIPDAGMEQAALNETLMLGRVPTRKDLAMWPSLP